MKLKIRAEQMSVIEALSEERFVLRIARHLLENYGDAIVLLPEGNNYTVEALDDGLLHSLVRVGISRARTYGITFESSIAAFTALMFEVCPNFDTHRLSQVLLQDEEVEPNSRLDELLGVLTEKNWDSIRETYEPAAWEQVSADNSGEYRGESSGARPLADEAPAVDRAAAEDLDETMLNI